MGTTCWVLIFFFLFFFFLSMFVIKRYFLSAFPTERETKWKLLVWVLPGVEWVTLFDYMQFTCKYFAGRKLSQVDLKESFRVRSCVSAQAKMVTLMSCSHFTVKATNLAALSQLSQAEMCMFYRIGKLQYHKVLETHFFPLLPSAVATANQLPLPRPVLCCVLSHLICALLAASEHTFPFHLLLCLHPTA